MIPVAQPFVVYRRYRGTRSWRRVCIFVLLQGAALLPQLPIPVIGTSSADGGRGSARVVIAATETDAAAPHGQCSAAAAIPSSSGRTVGASSDSRLAFALALELTSHALAILDVPRWRLHRTITIVTARDVPLTPPAQRFRSIIRSRISTTS